MATKNIARTAIEGGREGSWQVCVRFEERAFRRQSRVVDEDSDYPVKPRRINKRGFQTDHLSPVLRFLQSRVGKPWDYVWSEVKERFDTRTIAGQHVMDHIKGFFGRNPQEPGIWGLFIDSHGFLRKEKDKAKPKIIERIPMKEFDRAENFLQGRCVRIVGSRLHWLEPTKSIIFERSWSGLTPRLKGLIWMEHAYNVPYRQGPPLSKKEIETFESFPFKIQGSVTIPA
jgi:hypothetical protein